MVCYKIDENVLPDQIIACRLYLDDVHNNAIEIQKNDSYKATTSYHSTVIVYADFVDYCDRVVQYVYKCET